VLLSKCNGHILMSNIFKIHINTFSHPHIYPACGVFALGIPAKLLCAQILSVQRATFSAYFSLHTTNGVFRHPPHCLLVCRTFRSKIVVLCSRGKTVFDFCSFQS